MDTCNNYAVAICPAAGKGLKNAWQSEKILDFLNNESILSSFRITKRIGKQEWLRR